MTFEEAAKDPRRPLSLSPLEWMYSVEAKLNEEEELTERAAKRIAAAKKENKDENKDDALPEDSGTGVEKIDIGIDQLVSGCKIIDAGLREATFIDMEPKMRKHIFVGYIPGTSMTYSCDIHGLPVLADTPL